MTKSKWMPEIKVPHFIQQAGLMSALLSTVLLMLFCVFMGLVIFYGLCITGYGWWNLLLVPVGIFVEVLLGYLSVWIFDKWEYN